MKPYYDHDGITIYHGDCREILPQLQPVDLVLTDPPYGIGAANGVGGNNRAPVKKYEGDWDNSTCEWATDLILPLDVPTIWFGGNYYSLPPSPCWLVWHKAMTSDNFADCELAWTNFSKPTRYMFFLWRGFWRDAYQGKKEERVHPTQKPVEVIKWAIKQAPDDCETILDPFMGSGTTLRAAKDLGRKAIGIEIELKYVDIAIKRLQQEVLPLDLKPIEKRERDVEPSMLTGMTSITDSE